MAHFQERRSGGEDHIYEGKERRDNSGGRNQTLENLELIDQARFKAWISMTDKNPED